MPHPRGQSFYPKLTNPQLTPWVSRGCPGGRPPGKLMISALNGTQEFSELVQFRAEWSCSWIRAAQFSCSGRPKRGNPPLQKLRTDWVRLPKLTQNEMLQIQILKNEEYTVISGCKPCRDSNNGFLNCIIYWMRKSIVQKQ